MVVGTTTPYRISKSHFSNRGHVTPPEARMARFSSILIRLQQSGSACDPSQNFSYLQAKGKKKKRKKKRIYPKAIYRGLLQILSRGALGA
jgi:hypothetical protein